MGRLLTESTQVNTGWEVLRPSGRVQGNEGLPHAVQQSSGLVNPGEVGPEAGLDDGINCSGAQRNEDTSMCVGPSRHLSLCER